MFSSWDLTGEHGCSAKNQAWAPVMGALSLNCLINRDCQAPANINWGGVPQRSTSQHQDLALHNYLEIPLMETSGQIASKTGRQSQPSKRKKKWDDKKHILQAKKQGKRLQDQISEEEIGNLSEK